MPKSFPGSLPAVVSPRLKIRLSLISDVFGIHRHDNNLLCRKDDDARHLSGWKYYGSVWLFIFLVFPPRGKLSVPKAWTVKADGRTALTRLRRLGATTNSKFQRDTNGFAYDSGLLTNIFTTPEYRVTQCIVVHIIRHLCCGKQIKSILRNKSTAGGAIIHSMLYLVTRSSNCLSN